MNSGSKPNIILIVLDAVRYDHLSCYGYARPTTPNIDQLAERGVIFENAFSTAPWTPPSHASLFTGKYPSQCGVVGKRLALDRSNLTMAEFLRQRGYRTAGVVGAGYVSRSLGYDYGFETFIENWRRPSREQLPLLGYKLLERIRAQTGYGDSKGDYATWQCFRRWVKKVHRQGPFFAFLRFLSAHSPYSPAPSLGKSFEPPLRSEDDLHKLKHIGSSGLYSYIAGRLAISRREWEFLKAWYDASILYMDNIIGRMVNILRQQGLLESTLWIVTADHGENFGEHGLAGHVYCVYDTLLHVPLIVAGPEGLVPQGQRIEHLVSLVDIFPTVRYLVDPQYQHAEDLVGKSLFPLDTFPIHDQVFAEYGPPHSFEIFERLHPDFSPERFDRAFKTVRTPSYKYIWTADGGRELYDLATDPGEHKNIAMRFPELVSRLHHQLTTTLGDFSAPASSEPAGDFTIEEDARLRKHLEDLGYL